MDLTRCQTCNRLELKANELRVEWIVEKGLFAKTHPVVQGALRESEILGIREKGLLLHLSLTPGEKEEERLLRDLKDVRWRKERGVERKAAEAIGCLMEDVDLSSKT